MNTKVMLVTGASRGIGAATAQLAAVHGYSVCVNFCNGRKEAEAVVDRIQSFGGTAIVVQADTTRPDEVEAMFRTVDRELGPPTALVNNAGISGKRTQLQDMDVQDLKRVLETNVAGYFLCAREAVRRMTTADRPGGAIVNVSSQAGQFGGERILHYAASKAAVNTLTIGLAREVAASGIRVNAVSPGVIATQQHAQSDPKDWERLRASIPLARIGTAEEVAEAILWLLSDKASYVTGAILPVAGGR